jgi:hypothetical protein
VIGQAIAADALPAAGLIAAIAPGLVLRALAFAHEGSLLGYIRNIFLIIGIPVTKGRGQGP